MERVFDFRFAYLAIGLWAGAIAWFSYSIHATEWLVLVAALCSATLYFVPNKKLAIGCFVIGCLVTGGRFHLLHNADHEISNLSGQTIEFQITSDPQLIEERFAGALSFDKDVFVYADIQRQSNYFPIALSIDEPQSAIAHALPSSIWKCEMSLKPARSNLRYLAFAACKSEPKLIAGENHLHSVAGTFRNALAELTYKSNPSEAAALLPGLVVGDNQAQSDELVRNLRISGLGHLTAVSGANVAILLLFVQFLLQRTQISDKWRLVILVLVLIAFVVVARPSPSVVRAAMMAGITLLYWIKGFQKLSEGILFLSVSVLLLIDPWLAISWGFALSVAATLGLILLPRFWGVDANSSLAIKLSSTAFAASLATMPILIMMGSPVTFATVPANILAEFMVAPATVLGLIAPLTYFIPGLNLFSQVIANAAIGSASLIVAISKFFANSVFAINILSVKGIGLLILMILVYRNRKSHVAILALLVISALLLTSISSFEKRWQIQDWELAVCDIGQGDATLIRTGENSAMVVDVGPDQQAMKNCLTEFKIDEIDLFVASHFHADHIGGIAGLVEIAKPNRVITAALAAPNSGVGLVESQISPTHRELAHVGMQGEFNDTKYPVSWQVLFPASSPVVVDESNGSQINNNSVVLLVTTLHHRILLTGDIEIDGQEMLMRSISDPKVDIVKVPHHGSAYQSPGFAQWVHAQLAWISVGKGNSYGHPNASTILLFQSAGSQVLSTMDCGHITIGVNSFSTSSSCV
jgi:competence protein ComEC